MTHTHTHTQGQVAWQGYITFRFFPATRLNLSAEKNDLTHSSSSTGFTTSSAIGKQNRQHTNGKETKWKKGTVPGAIRQCHAHHVNQCLFLHILIPHTSGLVKFSPLGSASPAPTSRSGDFKPDFSAQITSILSMSRTLYLAQERRYRHLKIWFLKQEQTNICWKKKAHLCLQSDSKLLLQFYKKPHPLCFKITA